MISLVDRYAQDTHSAWATAQWGPLPDFAVIRVRSFRDSDPPKSLYTAQDCQLATGRNRALQKYFGLVWGEVEEFFVSATEDKVIVRLAPALVSSDITCAARTLYLKQLNNVSSFLQANTAAPRFSGEITSSMFDPQLDGTRLPQMPNRIYISIRLQSMANLQAVTAHWQDSLGSIMEFIAGLERIDVDTPSSRMYELIASNYEVVKDLPKKADNVACAGCEH
ncbi:hypothetical protein B0H11DRAFT_2030607, partial [Mycena galericulata]